MPVPAPTPLPPGNNINNININNNNNNDSDVEPNRPPLVRASDRVKHVTWTWFLLTMSTGGIAIVLGQQPHTFRGLQTIGKVVFIWDLVLFVIVTALTVQRFVRQSDLLLRSIRNPSESLFLPALMLSVANILICIQIYGVPSVGPWLIVTLRVLFWIYAALSFLLAVFLYTILFTCRKMSMQDVQPAWILPILPVMLTGTIASSIASMQPAHYRMSMLVAGVTFQGLGFWAAISLYGALINRLMKIGLPKPDLRPGMFVAVAPPAYTCLAIIKMSNALSPSISTYFTMHPTAVDTLQQVALAFGIFVWSLACWWFCIALVGMLLTFRQIGFSLVSYSIIFPCVGFTLSTIAIGQGLMSNAILWVASIMSILLVATYLSVLVMHARAIYRREVLWPGKDEDKET